MKWALIQGLVSLEEEGNLGTDTERIRHVEDPATVTE